MPRSKSIPKPVKAWAIVPKHNGWLYAMWTFDSKDDINDTQIFHRENHPSGERALGVDDRWVPVIIVPTAHYVVKPKPRRPPK